MSRCSSKMTRLSPSEADREIKNIVIGRVGAPHGVRGEARVVPMTDFPERFEGMSDVLIDDKSVGIEHVRYHNDKIIIKFKGCDSRDDAQKLTGKMLSVPRSEAMPLNEGEYYTFDIIGLLVFDDNGEYLGKVVNVLETGSNDVYVARDDNGSETLIPALKSVVKEINLKDSRMVVSMPEVIE